MEMVVTLWGTTAYQTAAVVLSLLVTLAVLKVIAYVAKI